MNTESLHAGVRCQLMRNRVALFFGLSAFILITSASPAQDKIAGQCVSASPYDFNQVGRWTAWSPDLSNTRFQSSSNAGLTAADVPKLVLKWAFGFPSATSAYSHLTVAGGRVFIGSQEQLYSTKDG